MNTKLFLKNFLLTLFNINTSFNTLSVFFKNFLLTLFKT